MCLPAVPSGKDTFPVVAGGAFRGTEIAPIYTRAANVASTASLAPSMQVHAGGMWVAPVGDALVPNDACVADAVALVRRRPDAPGDVRPLADAVGRAVAVLSAAGVEVPRLSVEVGFGTDQRYLEFRFRTVGLAAAAATRGVGETTDTLAREAVALRVAGEAGLLAGDQSAAIALLRWAWPEHPATPDLFGSPPGVRAATARAEACPGGWPALVAGTCPAG